MDPRTRDLESFDAAGLPGWLLLARMLRYLRDKLWALELER